MGKHETKKVIVWAVDPFEKNKQLQKSAAYAIKALAQASDVEVQPVYVCSAAQAELISVAGDHVLELIGMQAGESLRSILGQTKVPGLRSLRLLPNEKRTLGSGVRKLLRFAKALKAELIVVSSHGRS